MKYLIILLLIFILLSTSGFTVEGLLNEINQMRTENGLTELQQSDLSTTLAEQRFISIPIINNAAFHEINSFTYQASKFYVKNGVKPGSYMNENLACLNGDLPDDTIVQAWMDSSKHREAMLWPGFEKIGIYIGLKDGRWVIVVEFLKEI